MIKAIDTLYNGYKFRSRLEARWAVFFDHLSVKYEYEKEGYDLDGEWYLPDFWIPDWKCWIEIKPNILHLPLGNRTKKENYVEPKKELNLCRKLSDNTNRVVLLIGGSPYIKNLSDVGGYYSFEYEIIVLFPNSIMQSKHFDKSLKDTEFGLLIEEIYPHILSHKNYSSLKENSLFWFILNEYKKNSEYFKNSCPKRGDVGALIEADRQYYLSKHKENNPNWKYDLAEGGYVFNIKNKKIILINKVTARSYQHEKIIEAYNNAQQARFEKGKNGA
jgi:hypothetical protein